MAAMALNSSAQMWTSYKKLQETVEAALLGKRPEAIHDLESLLTHHKPHFTALLKNPPKNASDRDRLKKSKTDGLLVEGQAGPQLMTDQFISETCILSDLFDLNELAAAELLMTAEVQLPHFPGLTRGLVAVLLYYDGRRSIVSTLLTLVQCRNGRCWASAMSSDVVSMVTSYVDALVDDGLVVKILDLIWNMDQAKELQLLENERGLGNAKHRRKVSDLYSDIQSLLVECLFYWSCQAAPSKKDTLEIVKYLKRQHNLSSDGSLNNVSLGLLMALLHCIDVSSLDQDDDVQDSNQALPLTTDQSFVSDLHKEICSTTQWPCAGLQAVIQFAWAQTLRVLSQYPDVVGECDEDEYVVDSSIMLNVFSFLRESVIATEKFHEKEFYIRKLHDVITFFITHMPLKVKELRNRGDEIARIIIAHRQEGLEPPANLRKDFEQLLLLIGDMYSTDPLNLELCVDYWCPPEAYLRTATVGSYQPAQKQLNLFKFVRLSGDLLPPSLFTPYLHMLVGLSNSPQAAHHCFGLLKANGAISGSHSVGVSWDHFFDSLRQYHANLRQDVTSVVSDLHVFNAMQRSISEQELEGLLAFLSLTKLVAEKNEKVRIALCENQQWSPLVLLLGLAGCSIPALLKGKLYSTLAAFALTVDVATTIWQLLEMSQVVPAGNAGSQSGSLKVEIDEVETRNEEFPITLGFLELLNNLTEFPIPASLGSGYRPTGFGPYLSFVVDTVLMQFDHRTYKNPTEQWDVAKATLQVLYKLVHLYQAEPQDFNEGRVDDQSGTERVEKPGHALMVLALTDDMFSRKVLRIIDQSVLKLEEYSKTAGQSSLDECSLLCLKLIESLLEKQPSFFTVLRETGSPLMVSNLEQLLLGVNSRNQKADHLVNITWFVSHNDRLPEHALYAVKVLHRVCQTATTAQQLVNMFTVSKDQENTIRHGFVECLEAEEDTEPGEEEGTRSLTKMFIMKLLLSALDQPSPNIAHFLLGYELQKPVAKTNLQDPGILGAPRTCLHSVITTLDKAVMDEYILASSAHYIELGYHLIHALSAHKETSTPTLRYLRTAHDFLFRHLHYVPFPDIESDDESIGLCQQSWLLKTVALDLRLTSVNRQRSHTQRMVDALFQDVQSKKAVPSLEVTLDVDANSSRLQVTEFESQIHKTLTDLPTRRKVLSVLDSVDFNQVYPRHPVLQYFDSAMIENLISTLRQKDENGVLLCDIQQLYHALIRNVNAATAASAGQRQELMQEVELILKDTVSQNRLLKCTSAKRQLFEAWRHVVEVVLTACPPDVLAGEARQTALFEILQELFVKVSKKDVLPELAGAVSGTVLTLVAVLRQCFAHGDVSEANTSEVTSSTSALSFGNTSSSRTLFAASLKVVLSGLIEQILSASGGQQRVRANHYGALLYFLQISRPPQMSSDAVDAVDKSVRTPYDKLERQNIDTILSYGENLMEVLCRDSCEGHDVGRMVALSCLDAIITIDQQHIWLSYLISKGYLQHIVDTLTHDSKQLESLLSSHYEPLKVLYIFQAKMSLLSRVASSSRGSFALLHCNVMERLSNCMVLDLRPSLGSFEAHSPGTYGLDMMARYREILFPVLRFCLASMTSLSNDNRLAVNEVMKFVLSHTDLFCAILGNSQMIDSPGSMEEMMLATGVICRAIVIKNADNDLTSALGENYPGQLARIERQLMALLPRCLSLHSVKPKVTGSPSRDLSDSDVKGRQLTVLEIVSTIITYCTTTLSKSGMCTSHVLFAPNLTDGTLQSLKSYTETPRHLPTGGQPNLAIITYAIQWCTSHFMAVFESHKQTLRKLNTLTQLTSEELKELSGAETTDKLSTHQRQQRVKKQLLAKIARLDQEIKLSLYITENSLYILWRHLDYYLVRYASADSLESQRRHSQKGIRKLQGGSMSSLEVSAAGDLSSLTSISVSTIEQLREEAVSVLNESFYKKLNEIEQCYAKGKSRFGFIGGLVRRIKRMIRLQT